MGVLCGIMLFLERMGDGEVVDVISSGFRDFEISG